MVHVMSSRYRSRMLPMSPSAAAIESPLNPLAGLSMVSSFPSCPLHFSCKRAIRPWNAAGGGMPRCQTVRVTGKLARGDLESPYGASLVQDTNPDPPVFRMERLVTAVDWRALLHRPVEQREGSEQPEPTAVSRPGGFLRPRKPAVFHDGHPR